MSDEKQPEPGLVHVENDTTKRPNAVVLDRRTVALTVLVLVVGLAALLGFVLDARSKATAARGEAEAARAQAVTNEQIIAEVQAQSERNGALIEQGVDCLVALQQDAKNNAENANQAAADFHGYTVPPLPDAVQIPTETQIQFVEEACPRFFTFQEAEVGEPLPPPAP